MSLPIRLLSKKRLRDLLIILLISVGLFIPAAELTLRMLCSYCTWTEENDGGYVSPYGLNKSSWYHLRPPNRMFKEPKPEFVHEVRTNSLGFRDIEHPLSKPPGELRIMAVGDSFTEGVGARFEQTWLNQLGRRLNATHGERRFRMICGGVAASDPFYGYRLLADKLLAYQPDFVLLVVNHSDITDVMVRGGMERFRPDGTVKGVDPPDTPWMYESSHLVRFVLFELFDYTHYLITRQERDIKAQAALEKLMALMLEYESLLTSRNIRFILVVHPFHGELKRNAYDKLHLLKDFALQHHIDVIDTKPYLYDKLAEHDNRLEELYWTSDRHFTELGNRYVAEAIEIELRDRIRGSRGGKPSPAD